MKIKKLLLLILSFFIFAYAYAENDRAFFWKVSAGEDNKSKQTTVYLMGSMHFADKTFYPLRPEIERAFNESKYLVVELDVNKSDPAAYNRLLSQKGVYKDGKTIKDVLSDETWQQLRQRLRQLNVSYDAVKYFKPGVLVLTISAVQVMQMGFDPQLGLDVYFLTKAAQQPEKKIIEFETLEQQVELFLNIPDGELLIKESLYSLEESDEMMADMVHYWKQGDDAYMNKLLFEDSLTDYPAFGAIYDRLFYERNRKMVSKIDAMLKQAPDRENSYFVVVGSGHLIGEKGIVNSLKEMGFEVKRL
jgi:uncharacterized protein